MREKEYFFTVEGGAAAEFKDRGSKFIALSFPIKNTEEFKKNLQQVKKSHPKANHYCFAYRLGIDENNYRASDDGEPSGTAGRVILGQIDAKELTDTLVIVVRYFGGTLLGTSGLVNAYKTATSLVLQCSRVLSKPVEQMCTLHFNYTGMNSVMLLLRQFNCRIVKNETQLFCLVQVAVPKNKLREVVSALQDIKDVECVVSE